MYFIILAILLFFAGYATSWVYKWLNYYFDTDNRVYIQRFGITVLILLCCTITFFGTMILASFLFAGFFRH